MTRLAAKLPLLLFLFAVAFFPFCYGLAAGLWKLPPAETALQSYYDLRNLVLHWRNDFELEPSRHLVEGYPERRQGFVAYKPEALGEGRILVSGLTPGSETINGARLLDSSGEQIQFWPLDYGKIDPGGPAAWNVFQHGIAVLPDGSLIVNFDAGKRLARFGPCGEVVWASEGSFHHSAALADDGTLWTLRDDSLVQVDAANGAVLAEISLVEDLIERQGLHGILALRSEENPEDEFEFGHDPLHGNHVEALPAEMAAAFPMFEAGDLLISLRNLNLVGVVDPDTKELKWWKIGPWHRQHDPHFAADGRILVYNNDMNFGPSQILAVNPASQEVEVVFEGSEAAPFYSWRRGKFQALEDGRLLITESERGRVFMVDAEGEMIFEYNNIYDETYNGVLSAAFFLPPGFFEAGALDCPSPAEGG